MGNLCCSNEAAVVKSRDAVTFEKGYSGKGSVHTDANKPRDSLTGIAPKASGSSIARGNDKAKLRRHEGPLQSKNMIRRQSEETIWFDAMDKFPSDSDMSYPPTQSMRQPSFRFDLKEADSRQMLLNSSVVKAPASPIASSRKGEITTPPSPRKPRESVAKISAHLSKESPGTQGSGYPGELTQEELETCLAFREELKKRDPAFKEMVMAMHPHENEAFALCRFLRAREFNIEDVFTMMQEKNQVENWHNVKKLDPNIYRELHVTAPAFNGCPLSVFLTQFPMIHAGIGRNGAIILYVKAGKVNCPGVECIVGDIANALPYVWNRLYHGCRDAMKREIARSNSATTTVLAEKIIVADLAGDSTLFSSGMSLVKNAPIASASFPEAVNRTYILNAPFSFSIVWAVIRQFIDPRTIQKIGFFSTIAKAKTDFLKHIDVSELLSCYGGAGKSFDDAFALRQREFAHKEGVIRYVVELLAMNGREVGFDFDLSDDETVDSIVVYSRSDRKCKILVVDGNSDSIVDSRDVSRDQATSKVSLNVNEPDKSKPNNNYAVEIATSNDFGDATGPFRVNTKGGTKGDYYLVAISIAEKHSN